MAKKRKVKRKLNIDFSKLQMLFKYHAINFLVPLLAIIVIGVIVIVFIEAFKVNTVTVEGAKHYTDQEIIDYVLDSKLSRNSIYLNIKYKNKSIKDVPFVERIDVKIVDRNTVEIKVYEKYLAGCVANLGNYMYFDNDGIVVEVSKNKTSKIPVVTGLDFDHFNVYEPLPVDNPEVFRYILDITKLLDKYGLDADIINFDENMDVEIDKSIKEAIFNTITSLSKCFLTRESIFSSSSANRKAPFSKVLSLSSPAVLPIITMAVSDTLLASFTMASVKTISS